MLLLAGCMRKLVDCILADVFGVCAISALCCGLNSPPTWSQQYREGEGETQNRAKNDVFGKDVQRSKWLVSAWRGCFV